MSVGIWPPIEPEQLKIAIETAQKRELDWLLDELYETLTNLKHGLDSCYALLAPVDPGSTLVLSTPRNEVVKGHITRVGTRIMKGTINLKLKTISQQSLTIDSEHPIHVNALDSLHSLLTHSIDLLTITLTYTYPRDGKSNSTTTHSTDPQLSSPQFLAAQLRLLSQSLAEASSLLKGPPLNTADPSWTTRSVAPSHFTQATLQVAPGLAPPLSVFFSIQDSCLVLWLRSLEPADAPVNFGQKLAFAIGTARRLEHDEAERVFGFCCGEEHERQEREKRGGARTGSPGQRPVPLSGTREKKKEVDVFVREKVRVETADPSLLSLSSKLVALGYTLATARRNLAAVMGEELED